MDWAEFLRIMRVDEEGAQQKYRQAAAPTPDAKVREVLERLAYEEEIHAGILENEAKRLEAMRGS